MAPSTMLHVDGSASQPSKSLPLKIFTQPLYGSAWLASPDCSGVRAYAADDSPASSSATNRTRNMEGPLRVVRKVAPRILGGLLTRNRVAFVGGQSAISIGR